MVLISDIQVSSDDRDVLWMSFSEGGIRGGFVCHYGWVVIVANEVESQTGSGVAHQIISNDTNISAVKNSIMALCTGMHRRMDRVCRKHGDS